MPSDSSTISAQPCPRPRVLDNNPAVTSHGPCPAIIPLSPHKSLPILTSPLAFFTALHLEHRWLEDYVLVFSSTPTAPQSPTSSSKHTTMDTSSTTDCSPPAPSQPLQMFQTYVPSLSPLRRYFTGCSGLSPKRTTTTACLPGQPGTPRDFPGGGGEGGKLAQPHAWES